MALTVAHAEDVYRVGVDELRVGAQRVGGRAEEVGTDLRLAQCAQEPGVAVNASAGFGELEHAHDVGRVGARGRGGEAAG